MVRKLLAVVFAATLMAGTVWAVDITEVTSESNITGVAVDAGVHLANSQTDATYTAGESTETLAPSTGVLEVNSVTITGGDANGVVAGILTGEEVSKWDFGAISVTASDVNAAAGGILYDSNDAFTGEITGGNISVSSSTADSIAIGMAFVDELAVAPTATSVAASGAVTVGNIAVTGANDAGSEAHGIWGGDLAGTLTSGNITASAGNYAAGVTLGEISGALTAGDINVTSGGSAYGVNVGAVTTPGTLTVGGITVTSTDGNAYGLRATGASAGTIKVGAITVNAAGNATGLDLVGDLTGGTVTMNDAITVNGGGLTYGIYASGLPTNGTVITQNITATSENGVAKGIYTDTRNSYFAIGANVAIKGNGAAGSYDIDLGGAGDILTFDAGTDSNINYSQSIIVNGAELVNLGNAAEAQTIEFLAGTKFTGVTTFVNVLDAGDVTVHEGDVFDTAGVVNSGKFTFDIEDRQVLTSSFIAGGGGATLNKVGAGDLVVGSAITLGYGDALNLNEGQLSIANTVQIYNAELNVADNTVLAFDGVGRIDAIGSGAMNFSSSSILGVAAGSTPTGSAVDIITGVDATKVTLDGTAFAADGADLNKYLEGFNVEGLLFGNAFAYDGAKVTLEITASDKADAAKNVAGVLDAKYGIGDMAPYANDLAAGWFDIAGAYNVAVAGGSQTAIDMGNVTAVKTAGMIYNLGHGLLPSSRAAEAATNFLTGMDMAKSIEVSGRTAHRAVGNIFKRIQQNNSLRTAMNDAIGSDNALASSLLNSNHANRFWLAGMGMWEQGDRYKGNAGYDYDAYGLQLGYDRVFGALTFGGSFAYSNGDYEDKAALANDSGIEHYAFNLYGTYNHSSGFFASVVGGYTYSDYDMSAHNGAYWNKADYDADTWSIGTTLGYDFRPVQNFTITPTVGLYYYASDSDTFNSTGMRGVQIENHGTELPLALSMKYDVPVNACAVVSFEVNGGYTYNFTDEGGKVTARGYNGVTGGNGGSTTLKASRHSYNIGGGVAYNAERWDTGLKYDYYTSKASDAHVLRAEVGFKF